MRTIRRAALAASCGAGLAVAMAGFARAESLGDAISLAYETNPTLQAERAQLRATDEEYPQAEAGLRPTVSANGSYNWQDQSIAITGSPNAQTTGPAGQATLQVTQPIYPGGMVTSRIDAAKADILAERENLRRVEIGVLQTVIGSALPFAMRNAMMVLGGAVLLFTTSPELTGIAAVVVPLVVVPITLFGRRVRRFARAMHKQVGEVAAEGNESLHGIRTIQAFGYEPVSARAYGGHIDIESTEGTGTRILVSLPVMTEVPSTKCR